MSGCVCKHGYGFQNILVEQVPITRGHPWHMPVSIFPRLSGVLGFRPGSLSVALLSRGVTRLPRDQTPSHITPREHICLGSEVNVQSSIISTFATGFVMRGFLHAKTMLINPHIIIFLVYYVGEIYIQIDKYIYFLHWNMLQILFYQLLLTIINAFQWKWRWKIYFEYFYGIQPASHDNKYVNRKLYWTDWKLCC